MGRMKVEFESSKCNMLIYNREINLHSNTLTVNGTVDRKEIMRDRAVPLAMDV